MNENVILLLTNLFLFVLCAGLFIIIPYLTRKSFLFGVKIPAEEAGCNEAMQMKRSYIITCLTGSVVLLAVCVMQFLLWPHMTLVATLYLPLLIIPLYLIAFVPNWKKAVLLKEERKWAVSGTLYADTQSSQARGDLSSIPFAWYILSGLIVLAIFIATIARYPLLPDSFPVHFDINMEPDRWAEKSMWNVMQMPLFSLGLLIMMFFVSISIVKAKLQIDPNNPKLSFAQHRVYRRRMGHAIGFITLVVILLMIFPSLIILIPASSFSVFLSGQALGWIIIILSILSVVPIIVVIVVTGQGGCKVKIKPEDLENDSTNSAVSIKTKNPGRGDDKHWLLGMFYYNPDDPAIVIEARFGSKISFNFAHLPVKIGVGILALTLVAMYIWLTVLLV